MPAHIELLDTLGDPADPIAISMSGGETSATTTLEIWNDKESAFLDTETAVNVRVKLLTSIIIGYTVDVPPVPIYAPFRAYGDPVTEERWGRFRITHTLTAVGASTEGASGTEKLGTNADFTIPDLEPQTGVRVELYFVAPAGETADATKIKLSIRAGDASSTLSQLVTLAHGSGVIPPDRIAGLRSLIRGSEVTADDTDTVDIARGQLVYEGATVTFMNDSETFTLADGDAVDLLAAEQYLVTLSRTSAGALVATRGPKAEAVEYPAVPAGNVFVANLTVESADGIAVTVAQSSVIQTAVRYHGFSVSDGGGLAVVIEPGDGVTATDLRQTLSHRTTLAIAASDTSRIWRLADGTFTDTVTDVAPEWGADLLALVTTDTDSVTAIVDARAFAHRSLVTDAITLSYSAALSQVAVPATALAWELVPFDCEVEEVALDLRALDGTWTAGAIKVDVLHVAAGGAVTGGTTLFTSSATDDRRPSIAYNAATLRDVSVDHEVRRLAKGARLLLSLITTVTAPGAEPAQEIRVTLTVRRYR